MQENYRQKCNKKLLTKMQQKSIDENATKIY